MKSFLLLYGGSSSPGTPQDGPRAVFGRKEAACCLTQSGSSSPWKQLSEPRDAAAVLEPVVRAPLLPRGGSRSPGPPKQLKSRLWEPGSRFWSRFPRLYKARYFKRHLTIRVNPQQVNLLKNPLKSLHIDETMVGLSLALLPRA